MMVEPRRGVPASLLEEKLRYVHNSAQNAFNGNSDVHAQVEQYLSWAAEAERQLRPVMAVENLDRVLLTRRYWATHANPSYSPANVRAVQEEVRTRERLFEEMAKAVLDERRRWASAEPEVAFVVADTNVHLHHPSAWEAIHWRAVVGWQNRSRALIRLVLPMLVVDELDNAKWKNNDKIRSRARTTLKKIYGEFGSDPTTTWEMRAADLDFGAVRANLLVDEPTHQRLERADDELVDRALMLSDFMEQSVMGNRLVYFVSYDTGAALRARSAGLRVCHLVHGEDGN
ncbi:PIN domain-containing protein [Jatrophihabitans endophyticus]|uniref:PIN domain-containing protein n=2 Tax=Jatrophihabitans endophyticus TaxID=1206085 RepID=A0A1M5HCA7_9ACTN|nr:PIN domain-containing protein [Jatrophihabitans endophyticus]